MAGCECILSLCLCQDVCVCTCHSYDRKIFLITKDKIKSSVLMVCKNIIIHVGKQVLEMISSGSFVRTHMHAHTYTHEEEYKHIDAYVHKCKYIHKHTNTQHMYRLA